MSAADDQVLDQRVFPEPTLDVLVSGCTTEGTASSLAARTQSQTFRAT